LYNTAVIDTYNGCQNHISRLLKENGLINLVTCFHQWSEYLSELKIQATDILRTSSRLIQ